MRGVRSALIDIPPEQFTADRPHGGSLKAAIVERPLAGRIPKRGAGRGPVLMQAGLPSKAVAKGAASGQGSFFRACILLLVQEEPGHGYDLLERLTPFGFDSGDSGWLYRTLRSYEREAILASTWQISASGPPRRVYRLTPDGRALLDAWAASLRASKRGIDEFLGRHQRSLERRPPADA